MDKKDEIRSQVREGYGQIARGKGTISCCQSGGCCSVNTPAEAASIAGYSQQDLASVPAGANLGLGCGNPLALADLKPGETVLDLGSGAGFDCFLAREKVGETGYVIGVDMTADMINLARRNAAESGYNNIEFRLGEIEHLPVADSTADVVISNCVLNLSPEKGRVLAEAFRVLKPGGRLAVSDILALAELPDAVRSDPALVNGCIGGAETITNMESMLKEAGFTQIQIEPWQGSQQMLETWTDEKDLTTMVASCRIVAVKESSGKKTSGCCNAGCSCSDCC